jgi:hypothetical protein
MAEVQAHGKLWEKELAISVYKLTEAELRGIDYTATHDIPGELNRMDPGTNISVKTSCSENNVGMGDALRVYDTMASGHPIHATVLFYDQDCNARTKTVKRIVEVNLTGSTSELFGTVTRADLVTLNTLIHAVPRELRGRIVIEGKKVSAPSVQRTAYLEKQVELLGKTGAIYLNPKLDETNCRLQCSFNRFKKFLTDYPERIIASSITSEFRGGHITRVIHSGPREFTKKRALENSEWASASLDNLKGMTVKQLKKGSTIAGISAAGTKAILVERIHSHYAACAVCTEDGTLEEASTSRGGSRKTRKNRY